MDTHVLRRISNVAIVGHEAGSQSGVHEVPPPSRATPRSGPSAAEIHLEQVQVSDFQVCLLYETSSVVECRLFRSSNRLDIDPTPSTHNLNTRMSLRYLLKCPEISAGLWLPLHRHSGKYMYKVDLNMSKIMVPQTHLVTTGSTWCRRHSTCSTLLRFLLAHIESHQAKLQDNPLFPKRVTHS